MEEDTGPETQPQTQPQQGGSVPTDLMDLVDESNLTYFIPQATSFNLEGVFANATGPYEDVFKSIEQRESLFFGTRNNFRFMPPPTAHGVPFLTVLIPRPQMKPSMSTSSYERRAPMRALLGPL